MDTVKIAAAFRALADAFESDPECSSVSIKGVHMDPAAGSSIDVKAPGATPKPRGRPKKEEAPVAVAETPDPFAPVAVAAPVATLDEVRKALTALRSATTQDNAVAVLKAASGAGDLTALTADKYGAVVAAAAAAMPAVATPVVESDPFATPAPAAAEVKVTLEDVQKEVVAAQKRTASGTVQKIVMDAGGKAPRPDGAGGEGPSLKALPAAKYAAVIAALKALPTTK